MSDDDLTAPSIESVRTTFAALERSVHGISADCRAVSETLDALGEALHVITQGGGAGQEWGGFGMIGLPIMGAIRAVKGIASQYVKQQTGVPLNTWTDLVASSSAQFEAYLSLLDKVNELSRRYQASPDRAIDLQQAREDREVLVAVRWQTQAWKQILSRVAQLGQVVDAILQVNLSGEPEVPEAGGSEKPAGLSGSLQRRMREMQTRTVEKSDLREWVLQPFVQIRDKVKQLPSLTERLSHEVALLEVLLDLEIAEIRACLGEISPVEARIVGTRVAANVVLPELAQRLTNARRRAQAYETYLHRLSSARDAGDIDDRVHAILADEYQQGLTSSRRQLAELEAQADVWRHDGEAVLDACAEWTRLELNVLVARRLAEQQDTSERRILLQREWNRLEEARSVLASL